MPGDIGYVVKVYPRFSETFIVTEILSREAQGEQLHLFALRPTTDTHFHGALARVRAPLTRLHRPTRASELWAALTRARSVLPDFDARFTRVLPVASRMAADEVTQAAELAVHTHEQGLAHLHAHFASAQARVTHVAAALAGVTYSVTTHAKDLFHESVDLDLLRVLAESAHHVVAISAFNEAHLRRIAPRARIELVPNGLDLDAFTFRAPTPPTGPLRVLAVGRLVEKKGFSVLLRATASARARGLDVAVDVVGSGELGDTLPAEADALGLSDVLTWHGPRTQEEIREHLRAADTFVAPCVVGADGNADGLPTVLLEAMATGTPCISTAVTGIPEVVRGDATHPDTGVLVPPGDVDALAAALQAVADPGFSRDRVAAAARALVERRHDTRRQAAHLRTLAPEVSR